MDWTHRECPGGPAWSETLACADAPCAGTGRWRSVSIGTVLDVDGLPTAASLVPKISETVVPEPGHMDDAESVANKIETCFLQAIAS
jgi:hypothetical protein